MPDQLASDLDFLTGTPTFSNYADELPGWELEAADAVRLFGADAVCLPGSDPCQATEVAEAWIDDVNQTLAHGHSEGIALATLAFHRQRRAVGDFGAETVAGLSLTDPRVKHEIAFWAATQKIPAALRGDRAFQAKDVMPFLAKALKPGEPEAWRLAVVMKEGGAFRGGHALVPFGYFKGKGEGQYVLRVYDSNWPGREQRLFIDARVNSWSYDGAPEGAAPRVYRGDAENGNLLYFSPLSAHEGPFEAPFAQSSRSLVVAATGSGVTLRDEGGAEVGLTAEGQVIETGGAVRPAFAQSRCVLCPGPAEIVNYTLSPDAGMSGSQTISLENFGNSSADGGTVNITGAGVSATLTGVRTEMTGALVTVDGKSMTYSSSQSSTPTTVSVTVAGPDGTSTTVTVTLSSSPLGDVKIDASDPNNVTVTTRNQQGETVTGTVTVTTTSATGEKKTSSADIEVAQGKTSAATVNATTGTSTVFPAPGTACDNGRFDRQLADGGVQGAETDVDCGGLCPGCGERKACLVGADCASSVCAAGRCQAPTCFDLARNGDEEDVDCGGSCFGTCRPGQLCRAAYDCAGTTVGSVCLGESDGGVTRCQAKERRSLVVTGLGQGSQYNLNGTVIDGQGLSEWRVTGAGGASTTVPFNAYRYHFKLGGQQPAPYQGNFNCALTNPTNDPALLAQSGFGDGGQPSLACTRVASTIVVQAKGCFGMSVPVTVRLDGSESSQSVPLNGVTGSFSDNRGVGSLEVGAFRNTGSVSGLSSRGSIAFDTVMGTARRQTCPTLNASYLSSQNRSVFEVNYECECATGDFRGPTVSGDPCANAENLLGVLTQDQFVVFDRDTSTVSNNDFIFLADAGCGGNADPALSGSDKAFRVTVPPGLDLVASLTPVGSPVWQGHLSLVTDRAQCGTNGPTARTTGTTGAQCSMSSPVTAAGSADARFYNAGSTNRDVYVVLEGASMGDQGPYVLSMGAIQHPVTFMGDACGNSTLISANSTQSGSISISNDLIFSSASTGCLAATSPALSPNDVVYRMAVPAQTRLTVELDKTPQRCSVSGHLVRGSACGTNGASATTTGTTGVSCVASDLPRSAAYGCTRRPLVYDNKGSTTELVYLVLEGLYTGSRPEFGFTARTGPIQVNSVATTSGPAFEGNPCDSAPRRTWPRSTDDISTTTNNFYVLASGTCATTAASSTPSGSDTVLQYSVQPSHELVVKAEAVYPFVGHVPFFMHAVVGASACGSNAADFLTAGTTGLDCAVTGPAGTSAYLNPRTLRYTNQSTATQEVYVVFDAVSSSPDGIRYLIDATMSAPDAGVADAGTPDAGTPDAGTPDAGAPDAGAPDAGAPDSGTPDAGPALCSTDSQCPGSNNCYCAGEPGNCNGLGRCVPGRAVISAPTAGVAESGTFTVPAGCTQVHVSAWGSGGGQVQDMFGMSNSGGAGGYVSGLLSAAAGDVLTVWVGRGGQNSSGIMGDEGTGSYLGTATNGGAIEIGVAAGGGGGLTSVRQTGSVTRSFTVPAGGGAGQAEVAQPAGGTGAGTNTTRAGGDADPGMEGGGGGAGENGGLGAASFQGAGAPGAFGMLPMGLTSEVGATAFPGMPPASPAQSSTPNYALCPSDTGTGQGGNGCFVVRCTTP